MGWVDGRRCSECGSELVCQSPDFSDPHCFVCEFQHPKRRFPLRGWVWELLPRINFNPAMYGGKVMILPPEITFEHGSAYETSSLAAGFDGTPIEDRTESARMRDGTSEISRAKEIRRVKEQAKKILARAAKELRRRRKAPKHKSLHGAETHRGEPGRVRRSRVGVPG